MIIPFNKVSTLGNEQEYVTGIFQKTNVTPGESFSDRCLDLIRKDLQRDKVWLTNSCTSALEITALLTGIGKGDEIIIPTYTHPSTANPFIRAGATIKFIDSRYDSPLMDEDLIEGMITEKTKAIIPVHYGGVACNMSRIVDIAKRYGLIVIEDAAHAFGAYYKTKPLGTIGDFGCLSFHSTKNIHCFEGGLLIINNDREAAAVERILDKGTNRQEFINGTVDSYEWKGYGASFRLSEMHAAYLLGQLEESERISEVRLSLWNTYYNELRFLEEIGIARLPVYSDETEHNAHIFYLAFRQTKHCYSAKRYLNSRGIEATGHYRALDLSRYWASSSSTAAICENSKHLTDSLLRLPLFNDLTKEVQYAVISNLINWLEAEGL